jgi:hypothetical protein
MRLGWHIPLPGPFYLGGTIWQSKRHVPRRPYYFGQLPGGWKCPHHHRREDTARDCASREMRRRVARGDREVPDE